MNYVSVGGRLPVDSRLVRKLSDSAGFCASGLTMNYGSTSNYIEFAKLPQNDRLVMAAKMEGYTLPDEIALVTGLRTTDVNHSLTKLSRDGMIENDAIGISEKN